MSRFEIEIHIEDPLELSNSKEVSGVLIVKAQKEYKCRKLVLYCHRGALELEEQDKKKAIQVTMAKWETWETGKEYSYPFHFEMDGSQTRIGERGNSTAVLFFLPEIHIVGEIHPVTSAGWIPAANNLLESNSNIPILLDKKGDDSTSNEIQDSAEKAILDKENIDQTQDNVGLDNAELGDAIKDEIGDGVKEKTTTEKFSIRIYFDEEDRNYRVGDRITGNLVVRPDKDYEVLRMELKYQWRKHGRVDRGKGDELGIPIAEEESWQVGQRYVYPFSFVIENGPVTYRGHNENLDWYTWPEVTLDPELPEKIVLEDTEFMIVPRSRSYSVPKSEESSLRPYIVHFIWPIGLILMPLLIYGWIVALIRGYPIFFEWEELNFGQQFLSVLPFIIFLALASTTFRSMKSSFTSMRYQFAEMRLGPVKVKIDTFDDKRSIRAWVNFHPYRNVIIKAISLKLRIWENTTWRQGTQTINNRTLLHQSSDSLDLNKKIEVGDLFEEIASLLVPHGIVSDGAPQYDKSKWSYTRTIEQRLELRVIIKGWFNWRKEYPIYMSIL